MKNFAIHNIINSKPSEVKLHGRMTKEAFRLFHVKNCIVGRAQESIKNRIDLLSVAEKLAVEDENIKNFDENYRMVLTCIILKIKLWDRLFNSKWAA